MKALTLTQPWATLIAIGAKQIETRSWPTNHRGRLAIHASKTFPSWAKSLCTTEPFYSTLRSHGINMEMLEAACGSVVAIVDLVDVKRVGSRFMDIPKPPERAFGDYDPGRYMWKLENINRLVQPIPVKGAQGLWNLELLENSIVVENL